MKKLIASFFLAAITPVFSQTFDQVAVSAKSDLEASITQLEKLNEQIVKERQPLQAEESRLKDEAFALRSDLERILRRRDNTDRDLSSLQGEVKALNDNNAYITSLMGEYIRAYDNRLHISERQLYSDLVEDAKLITEDINLSASERFKVQLKVVEQALARMESLVGGHTFTGKGVIPGGRLKEGKYSMLGPVVYFSRPEDNVAGIASREFGSMQPSVSSLGPDLNPLISSFSENGNGVIPFDATLGAAQQIEAAQDSFAEVVRKGGKSMIAILGMAGIALLIAIFKFIEISGVRRARPKDLSFIIDALSEGRADDALNYAQKIKGPVGALLTAAVKNHHKDKNHVEEVLYEKMIEAQPKLERFLPFIAVTAATAPLLGLLGTVMGMITTFKLITIFGTGDAKSLSTGISEALITTQFGLIVAIPALIFHALLSRKSKGVLSSMERTAIGFINGLPGRK
jgi:biopolymer transport protein ExbB